jgi:hypothetical protein
LGDIFPLPFQGYVTTDRKISENPTQVKRWIKAMVRSLMFLRERPEEATEVALKRLRFRNITRPMLTDAIKSYVRAFPQGIPGMPSPEGVKNILEYEVRLPMKMEETLTAEKFLDLRWVEEVKKELPQKVSNDCKGGHATGQPFSASAVYMLKWRRLIRLSIWPIQFPKTSHLTVEVHL